MIQRPVAQCESYDIDMLSNKFQKPIPLERWNRLLAQIRHQSDRAASAHVYAFGNIGHVCWRFGPCKSDDAQHIDYKTTSAAE